MVIVTGSIRASGAHAATTPTRPKTICPQLDAHQTSPRSRAFSSASLMHLCSGKRCNIAPALTPCLELRPLQPFRYLHDCSGCFRLERSPGGPCTHWKAPPSHGAHVERTLPIAAAHAKLSERAISEPPSKPDPFNRLIASSLRKTLARHPLRFGNLR